MRKYSTHVKDIAWRVHGLVAMTSPLIATAIYFLFPAWRGLLAALVIITWIGLTRILVDAVTDARAAVKKAHRRGFRSAFGAFCADLRAALSAGKPGRRALTVKQEAIVAALYAAGVTQEDIAEAFRCEVRTIQNVLARIRRAVDEISPETDG